MSHSPVASVILTTYYRNAKLERALKHLLAQTYENIEIVVVDDSGEKHARETVEAYDEVEYVPHDQNRGSLAGWNTGMEHVSGKYVQFHDDDDWLFEDKISKQVSFLEQHPEIGSVHCGYVGPDGNEYYPPETNRGDVVVSALRHDIPCCNTLTSLAKMELLRDIFPLPEYPSGSDLVVHLELAPKTQFDFLDEVLACRDVGGDSLGSSLQNRKTRVQLVHDYAELYEPYPEVKRETLAKSYELLGRKLLQERYWSASAIAAFLRATVLSNGRPQHLLLLCASVFGTPGLRLSKKIKQSFL